jgi:hypothetical protein
LASAPRSTTRCSPSSSPCSNAGIHHILNQRLHGFPLDIIRDFQPLSVTVHHPLQELGWVKVALALAPPLLRLIGLATASRIILRRGFAGHPAKRYNSGART